MCKYLWNVGRPTGLINLQCIMGLLIDLSPGLWVVFLKSHLILRKHKAVLHSATLHIIGKILYRENDW